jgi:hypothetical protein
MLLNPYEYHVDGVDVLAQLARGARGLSPSRWGPAQVGTRTKGGLASQSFDVPVLRNHAHTPWIYQTIERARFCSGARHGLGCSGHEPSSRKGAKKKGIDGEAHGPALRGVNERLNPLLCGFAALRESLRT